MKNKVIQLTEPNNEPGYFSSNSQWLHPLLGTLLLVISTFVYQSLRTFDSTFESLPSIPEWLTLTAVVVGLSTSAVFAFLTGTLSAKIYLWVIAALANAGFWFVVFRFIYSLFH